MKIVALVALMVLVLSFPAGAGARTVLLSTDPSAVTRECPVFGYLKEIGQQFDFGYRNKADKRFGIKMRLNLYEARVKEGDVPRRIYLKPSFGETQTLKVVFKF